MVSLLSLMNISAGRFSSVGNDLNTQNKGENKLHVPIVLYVSRLFRMYLAEKVNLP